MDSLGVRRKLVVGSSSYDIFSLPAAEDAGLGAIARLPYSLKILLENLLRHEDGRAVTVEHLKALAGWRGDRVRGAEIPYHPVRILAPDSSGVPLVADLATMREAMRDLGADPRRINPLIPVDVVIDHSVIVDVSASPAALGANLAAEFARNGERYRFVRWAQDAFDRFRVVPPGNGILHQINLEVLARVVWTLQNDDAIVACPDAMIGMDSHTPMVGALGVLGWGVGGIEALAAMLGQPMPLAIPPVVGCRLLGRPVAGVMMTDVVLTLTQALRKRRVVATFVEFTGPGLEALTLPERATLANMAPEYGATIGYFPIDAETLRYLRLSGRSDEHVALVEAYAKEQGLWRDAQTSEPRFSDVVEFDLGAVEPSLAGPRRPQDRVALAEVPSSFTGALASIPHREAPHRETNGETLGHGDVVIAALTSCTNTSNPAVMVAAGLLARNAVARGLRTKPWVKTSLAPGSRIVTDYLEKAGLQGALDALGFNPVGYGCTTCMGNSGPLAESVSREIEERELVVTAVLSGNRNFEGRIHPLAKTSYLASPPLVVAYALAGSVRKDLTREPLGEDEEGRPVFLREIWPDPKEIDDVVGTTLSREMFAERYGKGFAGSGEWERLQAGRGETFGWDPKSELIRKPPFLDGVTREVSPIEDIVGARPLVILGDSVTTDHISPIGVIAKNGATADYLRSQGVAPADFGSYNLRRVNHEVMMRGTFARDNVFERAMQLMREGTPAIVVAGAEYGTGSSRDWAARGTRLLGVRAVLAESFERIHRSNLVGMGVLPLEFAPGTTRTTLGLDGSERFTILGLRELTPRAQISCTLARADGSAATLPLLVRIDTAVELEWYRNGGILPYVLRALI